MRCRFPETGKTPAPRHPALLHRNPAKCGLPSHSNNRRPAENATRPFWLCSAYRLAGVGAENAVPPGPCPLQSQQKSVIEIGGVVTTIFVDHQGLRKGTQF